MDMAVVDTERWAKGLAVYGEGQVKVVRGDKRERGLFWRVGRGTGRWLWRMRERKEVVGVEKEERSKFSGRGRSKEKLLCRMRERGDGGWGPQEKRVQRWKDG